MLNRYKAILSSHNVYKEIELTPDMRQLKVGTMVDCEVRLRKELFFGGVELQFSCTNGQWSVLCSDNLYLTVGDVRKMMTMQLHHGDKLEVKYQDSDNIAFELEFLLDFDNGKTYEREIDVAGCDTVVIGCAPNAQIMLQGNYVQSDAVTLRRSADGFKVDIYRSTYGVYINGKRIRSGDTLHAGDFLSISEFFFYFKRDKLWTQITDQMKVNGLHYIDRVPHPTYPRFNRNTRVQTVVCDEKIEILDPPEKPKKPKNNLFMRLMSSMGMLVASGVMAIVGGRMIIFSAVSAVMAVLTALLSVREGKKDYEKETAEREEKYNNYISNKKEQIEKYRQQEREELEQIYISQQEQKRRLDQFSPDLFDRTEQDEDYLCIRLGSGDVESHRKIDYKKKEKLEIEDDLQLMPEQICQEYRHVHDAPIVCDLKAVNAVGIVGAQNHRFEMMKNIVLDLMSRQYYTDVKLFFVAEEKNRDKICWLRMLPYVHNDVIGVRNIVCDDESKNVIFEYLYKELTFRKQNKQYENNIIVFFFDEYGFKSHPISRFINDAKDLGVTFLFFGNTCAEIPQGCGYIVDIRDGQNASLIDTADQGKTIDFSYPSISNQHAAKIMRKLAPVYTEEISLEGTLTKNISMFELLNIIAVDDIDLRQRWASSQVFRSMAAPIGVSKTGMISLDLHDKAHGPHGLVAGTTGSGKSEILQTYILSMATLFHPYEVGFVIIDFKGGGMVNQFKDLPHLLGAITNIDGKAINRSLKSIKAELQKRQRLFADADVNHIDKYIRKFKAGEVSEALPHLIIIVDEFAELKAEQPEFMKELISAARIGRSLGVHLILATQKPSGQVNEQIWSNSRFKLCLKVQSQQDSNEVLKSPLAAEIKEPGRAYLQVGNNEIFELFQSAYSGAPEKLDDANVKEFTIYSLTDSGKRVPVYIQKKKKSGEGSATQLDAIVGYVADYFEKTRLAKLPDICLPALGECIAFQTGKKSAEAGVYPIQIGVYDDPESQYQGDYTLDIGNNNLMMIGSAQSGKTNILQNIIRNLADKYTPDEVNIYIVDFASMVLKNFEKLNHVGGVVCPSDDEKLKNLFKLIKGQIETRKEKLIAVGVSSFAAYQEAGNQDLPLIVLMIDNLTALKELYFQDDDELLNICREGLSVGISVIISNAQTAGIGYKYLSNFSARIALYCNDAGEYGALFTHCRERIDPIPGRCIVELENRHLECQAYLAFQGEKEIDRVRDIQKYIAEANRKNRNAMARRIPVIPSSLTFDYIASEYAGYMDCPCALVTGLNYATVLPAVLNLNAAGLLAVSGKTNSGKHNWIKYCIDLLDYRYNGMTKIYLVDGISKKLAPVNNRNNVCAYSTLTADAISYVKEVEAELKKRYDALAAGNDRVLENAEMLVLVLDNEEAIQTISTDAVAVTAYKNIIGKYRSMKVCIIAVIDNAPISYNSPEIIKNVRDQRHVLFFDDLSNLKLFDMPHAIVRAHKKSVQRGDCYYIKEMDCIKLKTPIDTKQ